MFAKQTLWSASLVALFGALPARYARAQPEASEQTDDEVSAPGTVEPTPVEKAPPPKPTGTFKLGAGFSSDDGFIAGAAIEQPNMFRTGSYLGVHATISAKRQLVLTRFADPDLFGTPYAFSFDAYRDRKELPSFTRTGTGIEPTVSHPYGRHLRAHVGYRLEAIEVESKILPRGDASGPELRGGLLSALRAGVVYDTLDSAVIPARGTSIGISAEIADHRLGSDFNLMRLNGWAHTHQPLGPFTLHVGGAVTSIASRDPFGVPLNERLFIDSSREVRGYRAYTLGPVDRHGRPIGGDTKLTGRAELELPIVRRIGLSAVGFVDAGVVLDGARGELGASAGFGLIWRSPIGPLRFDWAIPLGGGEPVFGFGIGVDF